ncbi:hypothetical protein L6452_09668 [Arctium lappa]|uniref:Uncharacterized protein n=1 Tax=Arctium lappa TaxID=4217 RepID=A0ACB9DKX4_ARCLA|nr:hypothetical protein L6452_09668 [Arctium lappa]
MGDSDLKSYLRCWHCAGPLTKEMAPPVIVFSSACAGLAGGAVPALAQLASSSYHATVSSPSLFAPPPWDSEISS